MVIRGGLSSGLIISILYLEKRQEEFGRALRGRSRVSDRNNSSHVLKGSHEPAPHLRRCLGATDIEIVL